jgi:hypothetical protein
MAISLRMTKHRIRSQLLVVWMVRAGVSYVDVHIITGADRVHEGIASLWVHKF